MPHLTPFTRVSSSSTSLTFRSFSTLVRTSESILPVTSPGSPAASSIATSSVSKLSALYAIIDASSVNDGSPAIAFLRFCSPRYSAYTVVVMTDVMSITAAIATLTHCTADMFFILSMKVSSFSLCSIASSVTGASGTLSYLQFADFLRKADGPSFLVGRMPIFLYLSRPLACLNESFGCADAACFLPFFFGTVAACSDLDLLADLRFFFNSSLLMMIFSSTDLRIACSGSSETGAVVAAGFFFFFAGFLSNA